MTEGQVYLLVVVGGVITLLIRVSFLFLLGNRVLSSTMEQFLRYIPPATFAALTVPVIVSPAGSIDIGTGNLYLPAALVAFVVGMLTKSVLWVLASGMATLWILDWVVS